MPEILQETDRCELSEHLTHLSFWGGEQEWVLREGQGEEVATGTRPAAARPWFEEVLLH